MITVYGCSAPNPKKISIFLEEAGLPYTYKSLSLFDDDQKSTEYLAINPNGRFPAIIDDTGDKRVVVWESGAILTYLAEKTGQLLPREGAGRYEVLQWLFWQVSHAPYMGNAHLYRVFMPEPQKFEIKRFTNESARLYRLLDSQLSGKEWVAADQFTIADITLFPWIEYHRWHGQDLGDYPNIKAWFQRMSERPGVAKGRVVPYPTFDYKPTNKINLSKMKAKIARRLEDPKWAMRADNEDQAVAGVPNKLPLVLRIPGVIPVALTIRKLLRQISQLVKG